MNFGLNFTPDKLNDSKQTMDLYVKNKTFRKQQMIISWEVRGRQRVFRLKVEII